MAVGAHVQHAIRIGGIGGVFNGGKAKYGHAEKVICVSDKVNWQLIRRCHNIFESLEIKMVLVKIAGGCCDHMNNVAQIDELLACHKKLATHPIWQADPNSDQKARLKSSIEIGGEIRGNFSFILSAALYTSNHLEIQFILVYDGVQIERMAYNPHAPHTNQFLNGIPKRLRGVTLPAVSNRYYSWRNNRELGFPPPKHLVNLPAAEPIGESIADFCWHQLFLHSNEYRVN